MERLVTLIVPEDGAAKQPNDLTFRWNISVKPVLTLNVLNKMANSITIGWQADPYAKEHNIYQDGILIATLLNTVAKYTITELTEMTNYVFGVSSVDFLGQESSIVTVAAKTLEKTLLRIDRMPDSMSISSAPIKINYLRGETLDLTGLVAELHFGEETQAVPVDFLTVSGFDSNIVGLQTVTVSWFQFGLFSATFDVTIMSMLATSIELISEPNRKVYCIGDELELDGLIVKAIYDDSSEAEIAHGNLIVSGFDSSAIISEQEISVSYAGLPSLSFRVEIVDVLPNVAENYFTFNANTKTITGYDVAGGLEVSIPSTFNIEGVNVSVENIAPLAFNGKKMTRVVLPSGLLEIGENAFAGNLLTDIIIPDGVTTIGMAAFYNNKLKSVILPNSIQNVGSFAFDRNQLKSVVLSDQMTEVAERAFSDNVVTKITLPEQISYVGTWAFMYSPITEITLGEGVVFGASPVGELMVEGFNCLGIYSEKFVNAYVLNGRGAGKYLYNSVSDTWSRSDVVSISLLAAPSKSVYQLGEGLDLEGLSVEASYTDSTSAIIANELLSVSGFNSSSSSLTQTIIVEYMGHTLSFDVVIEDRPLTASSYFTFDSGTKTITGYDIAGGLDVVIPAVINVEGVDIAVEKIGVGAFKELGIASVVIPDSVVRIDTEAFYGNSLASISFSNNLFFIGASAFENNSISGLLVIPDSVVDLGQSSFANNQITGLTLGNQLSNMIADYAFFGNSLTSVVIPPQIQYIGQSAFGNSVLTTITIGAGVGFGIYNNSFGLHTDLFIAVYGVGAVGGTYVFNNNSWVKTV